MSFFILRVFLLFPLLLVFTVPGLANESFILPTRQEIKNKCAKKYKYNVQDCVDDGIENGYGYKSCLKNNCQTPNKMKFPNNENCQQYCQYEWFPTTNPDYQPTLNLQG